MALVTVNIDLALPTGGWVSNARVEFTLVGFDTDIETIVDEVPVYAVLDTSGVGSIALWPNASGIRGTVYAVNIVVYSDDSYTTEIKRIDLGNIQLAATPTTQTLSALLGAPISVSGSWYSTITEDQYNAAIDAVATAAASATSASTSATTAAASATSASTSATAASASAAAASASAAELNILDGVTASAAELNILDGVTATTAELNILDGVTATTAELNILDGAVLTTYQLNTVPQLSGRNLIINGSGRVNQRGYVSGTATTAANQFTLDRWFVVTSGQNLTFTGTNAGRVMTAPAGGAAQVIAGSEIEGGTYVINWTGTATCTVNGTAQAKGNTFTLTANANAAIKFTSGTFSRVQVELGSIATPFERVDIGLELAKCQHYFENTVANARFWAAAGSHLVDTSIYYATKRGIPSVTLSGGLTSNTTTPIVTTIRQAGCRFSIISIGAGDCYSIDIIASVDAEIIA